MGFHLEGLLVSDNGLGSPTVHRFGYLIPFSSFLLSGARYYFNYAKNCFKYSFLLYTASLNSRLQLAEAGQVHRMVLIKTAHILSEK